MNNEPVLTEYTSIYDEALRLAYNKVARNKFGDDTPRQGTLTREQQATIDETIQKIIQFKADFASVLKRIRSKFPTLGSKTLELKLKNTSKFKPFNQNLFADQLSGGMHANIADVKFPGEFGVAIEDFIELFTSFLRFIDGEYRQLPQVLKSEIPSIYEPGEVLKNLQLTQRSAHGSNDTSGLLDAIRFGITPVNEGGFYRLHAVNPPLDFFKSSTKGIGLGKYLYLAVIHHCGHGYTTSSSNDAMNMWKSMIKRTDIYSFMAPECGNGTLLAISVKLSPDQIIELLDKFINRKSLQWSRDRQGVTKNFLNWIAYRKMFYGDTPIEILDDELYILLRSTIDAYVEPSNLQRLFPGETPAEHQVDPSTLPNDQRLEQILISNLRDNNSAMQTIITNIVTAHNEGRTITGSIWHKAAAALTALGGNGGGDDLKTFWRSYYFILRKFPTLPSSTVIMSYLNDCFTSINYLRSSFLYITYDTPIRILNLGKVNLKIDEVNNILQAVYSKYSQAVQLGISISEVHFGTRPRNEDIVEIGRKYINLPNQQILAYDNDQIRNALVTTRPSTLGSTTPPVQSTVTPQATPQRGGRRRTRVDLNQINTWIETVGKTRESTLNYMRRLRNMSALYRRYETWSNNQGITPISYNSFKPFMINKFPEIAQFSPTRRR